MDTLQCSGDHGHSEYLTKVWGQYSHVWIRGWTFDLQVHSHVAFLTIVQPVGPQAEMHLWRPFHLKAQTRHWLGTIT